MKFPWNPMIFIASKATVCSQKSPVGRRRKRRKGELSVELMQILWRDEKFQGQEVGIPKTLIPSGKR